MDAAAAEAKIAELYDERFRLHAAMIEARGILAVIAQGTQGPAREQALRAHAVLGKPLGLDQPEDER